MREIKPNKSKWRLLGTFLIAAMGSLIPLIRNLFVVGWNFAAVDLSSYILIITTVISFFLAYQIVKRMSIPKKTESYYLSILGVHFIIYMVISLFGVLVLIPFL